MGLRAGARQFRHAPQELGELTPYGKVTAVPAAVSAATGKASLYRSPFHCDHRIYRTWEDQPGVLVVMFSIDEYLPPGQRVDLVKMDTQGAERIAIRGMTRNLSSNPGLVMFMAFWPECLRERGFPPETVLSCLKELGFVLYRIDECTGNVKEVFDPGPHLGSLAGSGYTNLLVVSGGVLPWPTTPTR